MSMQGPLECVLNFMQFLCWGCLAQNLFIDNFSLQYQCIFAACFAASQDQNLAPHPVRKNDAVAVVVHLHHPQGLEAVLLGHAVDQGLVQRAPVQGRGLSRVPAQDLPNGPVKGRRGLVFML